MNNFLVCHYVHGRLSLRKKYINNKYRFFWVNDKGILYYMPLGHLIDNDLFFYYNKMIIKYINHNFLNVQCALQLILEISF